MKIHYASIAIIAGVSVAFSSCVAPSAGYVSYSAPGGISTGVAWTNASYDADGFPIFGYAYGRPVYGYTAAGAAIFTIAALTALCYVPHWGPASWYHGHYHYPHGIHRVPQPPRYPAGHAPHVRPPAGAHKGPGMPAHAVHNPGINRPAPAAPKQPNWPRPGSNVAPQRPGWSQPSGHAVPRLNAGNHSAPGNNMVRPPQGNHMSSAGHKNQRPGSNNGGIATLPARPGSPVASVPSAGRPNNRGGAVTMLPTGNSRPVAVAPSSFGAANRAGAASRSSTSFGAAHASAGAFRGGAHHGGGRR